MVEIADQESAQKWLDTQGHRTQVWFACRCALRGLPASGKWQDATTSGLAFLSLRATLISAAAATCPAAEMQDFEAAARSAHAAAASSASSAASAASSAASAAAVAAFSSAAVASAFSAFSASAVAASAYASAFSVTSFDANTPLQWGPLWSDAPQPSGLKDGWKALKQQWEEDEADWSFWIEWYEAILNGNPLPWELTQRIALEITEEEWDAGQKVVAAKIRRIQAQFITEKAPLAETLEINPDTGLFRAVPIPIENAPLMSALLSRVADALEDALQGDNGLNDGSWEVKTLNRTFTRYSNDPQRVEMDFTSVAGGLRRQLQETGELPTNQANLALLEATEEGVRGLRATHPDVAANRLLLAQQAWWELSEADKELLADAQPVLIAMSEGIVAEDFAQDIPTLINDALLPLPIGAPPLPAPDPTTRIFNRVSKMSLLYKAAIENGAKEFDSPEFKTVRLGLTVSTIFSLLVGMAIALLGVL